MGGGGGGQGGVASIKYWFYLLVSHDCTQLTDTHMYMYMCVCNKLGRKSHNHHAVCVWTTSMAEGMHSCIHVHVNVHEQCRVASLYTNAIHVHCFFWMAFLFFSPSLIDFIE